MVLEARLKAPRKVFLRHPSAILLYSVFNKVRPYTCVMYDGLLQMRNIIKSLDKQGIEGNLVEAGCWRGGCGAFMAFSVSNHMPRTTFMLDSFDEFYPEFSKEDSEYTNSDTLAPALESQAHDIVRTLGVEDRTKIVKGFVHESLPSVKEQIGKIAILRLDLNLYEPTKETLEVLYDSIVPGGYIVLDNYEMKGERTAVDEFRSKRGIVSPLRKDGFLEKEYWIK